MAEYLNLLKNVLYTAGGVAFLFAVVFYMLYRHVQQLRQPPPRDLDTDLTNMRILFLTMRDMLEQQKDLARQLNENIDRKIAYMKRVAAKALEDLEVLRKATCDLAQRLDEASAELTSVQKQVKYAAEDTGVAPAKKPEPTIPEPPSPEPSAKPVEQEPEKSTLHILASPKEKPPEEDPLDKWAGLDLGTKEPEPQGYEAPEPPPEKPEDAEAARKAFKALLNFGLPESQRTPVSQEGPRNSGNGPGAVTPLQARVYEYNDAGMTVPEIARELGIGKGEVRLILSLRQDKG